jgi:hypothetical protein
VKDNNRSSKTPCKTDDKKSDLRTVYILTVISPNICFMSSENHRGRLIWIMNPRVFWTGDSEYHQLHPTTIHTQCEQNQCQKRTWSAWEKTTEAPQLAKSSKQQSPALRIKLQPRRKRRPKSLLWPLTRELSPVGNTAVHRGNWGRENETSKNWISWQRNTRWLDRSSRANDSPGAGKFWPDQAWKEKSLIKH